MRYNHNLRLKDEGVFLHKIGLVFSQDTRKVQESHLQTDIDVIDCYNWLVNQSKVWVASVGF